MQTFTAIIDCLCNLIPEACEAERGSDSGSLYHTQPERDALHILEYIFPCNIDKAIKAGLISKWLANYPFGGPDASPSRKHEIMIDISNRHLSYEDDEFGRSMNTILGHVFKDAVLRHQMIKDVLTDGPLANDSNGRGPRWDRNSETEAWNRIPEGAIRISSGWSTGTREILDDRMDFSDWFRQVPEGAVRTSEGYSLGGGQRRREESIEERALRRRRREAVVVGRNGQPIQSEDIIQREAAVLHEVVEEESEFDTADTFDWLVRPDGVDPVSS